VPESLRERLPAAEAFASASRQSGPDRSLRNHAARRHCAGFRLSHASSCRPCCRDPFYVAVVSGAITFTYWWLSGDKEHALIRTATVLVIACPHALGLAIPLVIAISTSLGARTASSSKTDSHLNVPAIWISSFSIRPEPDTRFSCSVGSRGCTWHNRRRFDCACCRCRI